MWRAFSDAITSTVEDDGAYIIGEDIRLTADDGGGIYVSINTVNTHICTIYSKLSARDRSSAVQRARELRLLSSGAAQHR